MKICVWGGNLFWGMQFAPFLYKTALNRLQVLSRLFCIKTAQSHTAITSIVIRKANQSSKSRHCENCSAITANERSEFSWQSTPLVILSEARKRVAKNPNSPSRAEGARGWVFFPSLRDEPKGSAWQSKLYSSF